MVPSTVVPPDKFLANAYGKSLLDIFIVFFAPASSSNIPSSRPTWIRPLITAIVAGTTSFKKVNM